MLTARSLALPRHAAHRPPPPPAHAAAASRPLPAHSFAAQSLSCAALRRGCSLAAASAAGGAGEASEDEKEEDANVLGGATVASQFPELGVKGKAQTALRTAGEEFTVLREFSQVHWTEVVSGLLFVLLMSEGLRFVVEGAAAAASGAPLQLNYWPRPVLPSMEELPERLLALSLVALNVEFSQRAFLQLRGARAALSAGANAAVRRFQACMALKLFAELGGLALIALRGAPAWGCALAFGGHVAFLLLNSLVVSPTGAVRETPLEARRSIASIDGTLAALSVAAAVVPTYSLLPASLVALFAFVFLFDKFVRKTNH